MRRNLTAVLLVFGLVAGCASPGMRPVGDGAARTTPPPPPTPTVAKAPVQLDVTAVHRTKDPKTVLLTVSRLAGAEGCSSNPQIGYHTAENNMIYANVVQDSPRSDEVGVCVGHTPGEVRLTWADPIGDRVLVLNQEAWRPLGDYAYEKCSKTLGCDPPPSDHCDPFWVQVTVQAMDVSRHSTGHQEACAEPWMVMTVPDDPAVCGAEPRDGCDATTNTWRYFLKWNNAGWQTLARGAGAGCAGAPKEFPRKLCVGLAKP
ncbi:hypothetical protein KOI35_25085 [Actinoplanes bogorensis]|uniref:Lipoprotein n=1 Tax=Paractinoplanes bogorensis TaxID=1610840 RepID=A0ABS5YTK3_9ACTN|nr:hypothetical protein [Actinoplanes bogorensis]MBU2666789.1 hypothetical protein [Actinoplanes bogorensis]